MAISYVWIEDGCISCGLAEGVSPEVSRCIPRGVTELTLFLNAFYLKVSSKNLCTFFTDNSKEGL